MRVLREKASGRGGRDSVLVGVAEGWRHALDQGRVSGTVLGDLQGGLLTPGGPTRCRDLCRADPP